MRPTDVILLIALAAALAGWGLAQLALSLFQNDRQKLNRRLKSRGQPGPNELLAQPAARPRLKDAPGIANRIQALEGLYRTLIYACPDARLSRFLMVMGAFGLVAALLAGLFMESAVVGIVGGMLGAYLPVMWINGKRKSRQRLIAGQLPDALDFLCRILRAGHGLSTGIQMMGEELSQPIGEEFRRCHEQHNLGLSLEAALREMAGRVEDTDFAFFVTAVLIQRQTGGDLSEVLGNISSMVRSRMRLQQHVKAITAEGRMTGYILVAFPAILFVISYAMNPTYMAPLIHTGVGKCMMLGAFGMQALGLVCIRKIVMVKV